MSDEAQRQAVKINGIEYSITHVSELNQAEFTEAERLFPRAASLLTWNVLEEEDAAELEMILKRIADIFLKSAPAEVRQRLSNEQRIQLLTPIKDRIVGELEGGDNGSR